MKGYKLTVEAEYDMDGILDEGIEEHGLVAALTYYDNLECRFSELVDNPLQYPAVDHISVGYRRTVCGVHSVYYRVESDGVLIVRILKKQDPIINLL